MDQNQVMNKAIAFGARRTPYYPELKTYCKTTNAVILMTQLEYWFASMPDGFYKFLAPCDHTLYKKGDSWTEELCFSEKELRNAFENIIEKHSSKRKVSEILQEGGDPFAGKYYLSFREPRNNLTYYKRNHILANQVINIAVSSFDPVIQQQTLDALADLQFPEIDNGQSRKLLLVSSGTDQRSSPNIMKQKITSEDHNKKKLASSLNDFREEVIADTLTSRQNAEVKKTVAELYQAKGSEVLGNDEELFFQAFVFELLNKNSFRKCQQEFSRKLFSIKQEILRERWKTPPGFSKKKVSEHEEQEYQIQEEIKQHRMNLAHAERMKALAEKNSQGDDKLMAWEIEVTKAQKWIEKLEADLKGIN